MTHKDTPVPAAACTAGRDLWSVFGTDRDGFSACVPRVDSGAGAAGAQGGAPSWGLTRIQSAWDWTEFLGLATQMPPLTGDGRERERERE